MGAKCAGPQYQQIEGDCENITVIVTICVDGMSIAPTVIFKGKGFQIHGKQENPTDASYVSNSCGLETDCITQAWILTEWLDQ